MITFVDTIKFLSTLGVITRLDSPPQKPAYVSITVTVGDSEKITGYDGFSVTYLFDEELRCIGMSIGE